MTMDPVNSEATLDTMEEEVLSIREAIGRANKQLDKIKKLVVKKRRSVSRLTRIVAILEDAAKAKGSEIPDETEEGSNDRKRENSSDINVIYIKTCKRARVEEDSEDSHSNVESEDGNESNTDGVFLTNAEIDSHITKLDKYTRGDGSDDSDEIPDLDDDELPDLSV